MTNKQIGHHYETLACNYLQRQGYQLIDRNYSCRYGEIDLIMRDNETILFVEVKYRATSTFGHASEMISKPKSRRLFKTAQIWLIQQGLSLEMTPFRFDVIAIHHQGTEIDWVTNAITQESLC